ncbi:MAG: methionyl-tRNA formyltransferase [Rhodospirillaceae bacterium]|jgi:methionyl-tRNA formyltransferase|nr:methionyl-tRNA formyltransferase [Rhodospirillaceae bacterium]MBT4937500.1 methionyl-tRNA formyltransferase [Rhodospirillaceae bacterium]MBT5938849.1 methionyl-tRNA formyltransferase [Rhodospirillaceae bacterium]
MAAKLRLAFMGTPDFSVPVLEALIAAGHEVVCVYAQPPRAAGRGQKEKLTPVHAKAEALGIEVRTPKSLKSENEQAAFAALDLDCAVVVAYGLILPKAILDAPRLGCVNIHASLLPRWRGAAPIQRAILAGDERSGVTIMQMDEGLDTGAMLLIDQVPLTVETTGESLHDALSEMGTKLIVEALEGLAAKTLSPTPQPDDGVTYASKLERAEGHIDWSDSAEEIERLVRAFTPWPGSWFEHHGERIKIITAELAKGGGEPGAVLDDALNIACGEGALRLTRVQRAGKGPMAVADFLRGFEIPAGSRLS